MTEETHKLFHDLWTKAVGTPGYDKKEWIRLSNIIEDLDVDRFNDGFYWEY